MIDQSKRKTLKTLAASAGAMAGGALTLNSNAFASAVPLSGRRVLSVEEIELGSIEVYTRVSVTNNDLEVVLTNAGKEPVTITRMTPSVTRVARGEFDFSALVKDGPLTMGAGESVTIPLKRKTLDLNATVASVHPLNDSLRKTMSIVTDDNAFASVSFT